MTRTLLLLPLLLAASVVLAAEGEPDVATRDLVILPVEMPEAEQPAGEPPTGEALMNWSTGVLRVTGRGYPNKGATRKGQRRIQARSAAQNMALRNLAYALAGTPVTSDATFREYLKRQGGKTGLQAYVRGHRLVEMKELEEEAMLATLEMPLRGRRDLAEALFSEEPRSEPPTPRLREDDGEPPTGLTPAGDEGPFTGVVVVADGLKAKPALRVSLFDAEGERVYGPGVASLEAAMEHGLVTYVRTVGAASRLSPVGERPLVVRAAGINDRNGSDLILSTADANRIRTSDRQGRFLQKAAVAFVLP